MMVLKLPKDLISYFQNALKYNRYNDQHIIITEDLIYES